MKGVKAELPGGLVVRILQSHCHGPGSGPGQETDTAQATWQGQEKRGWGGVQTDQKAKLKIKVFYITVFLSTDCHVFYFEPKDTLSSVAAQGHHSTVLRLT